jgi:hypothetical protein
MLKKLLIGLFLLGMLCGAGSISAGPSGVRSVPVSSTEPAATDGVTTPTAKTMPCGGGC